MVLSSLLKLPHYREKEENIFMSHFMQDAVSRSFWSDPARFADLFNAILFEGEEVINPDDLVELDPRESLLIRNQGQTVALNRVRDVVMKTNGKMDFVILGIENQTHIDYQMPLRTRMMDDLNYQKQVKRIKEEHQRNKELKESEEFLSGMKGEDRLMPVFNAVIYYGEKPWTGPRKLSDMMEMRETWKKHFQDYEINLIEVVKGIKGKVKNEEVKMFLELIQDLNQKEKEELLQKYEKKKAKREVIEAVAEITKTKKLKEWLKEEKGEIIMCRNMDRLFEEERKQGYIEGQVNGFNEGKNQGFSEGQRKGFNEGAVAEKLETIKYLKKINMPIEQIAEVVRLSEKEIQELELQLQA